MRCHVSTQHIPLNDLMQQKFSNVAGFLVIAKSEGGTYSETPCTLLLIEKNTREKGMNRRASLHAESLHQMHQVRGLW